MPLPNPPLMKPPARSDVRERWIGRKVRYHKGHLTFTPRNKEDEAKRERWISLGVGEVLDVGRSMWLLVRWSNGEKEHVHKTDIEVVS